MKTNLQDVDIRLLKIFRAIADCRGLTPAAHMLNTTVPAVSNGLSDLEARLGLSLCQRGRSGFRLTEEGEEVYKAHTELLKNLERFSNQVGDITGKLVGEVRIALINGVIDLPELDLPAIIRTFKDRSPYTTLSVEVQPARAIEEALILGQIDIGITVFQREVSELTSTPLTTETIGLYCGDQHPLFDRDAENIPLDHIDTFERCYRDYIRFANGRRRKELDIHTAKANDLEVVALMILSGRFLGFLPTIEAQYWIDKGRMKQIRPDHFQRENEIVVLQKVGAPHSKAVKQFLRDIISRRLSLSNSI